MSETYTTDSAETLAELVLIDHRLTTPVQCSCGWREPDDGGTHAAHVRDALTASGAVRPAAEVRAEARREIGLWATQRKAFIELQREKDRREHIADSEWWRGHESALDDLIRTVTSDAPTAPGISAVLAEEGDRG